eukprot:748443-Hanusia_phi.AAC.8
MQARVVLKKIRNNFQILRRLFCNGNPGVTNHPDPTSESLPGARGGRADLKESGLTPGRAGPAGPPGPGLCRTHGPCSAET